MKLVEDLDDEHLNRAPSATTTSIAWNLWHLARWADRAQANLTRWSPALAGQVGTAGEIWETEHLATQWGFDVSALGWRDTGIEMGLDEAHALRMPSKAVLLDYAQRSFAAVTRLITQLADDILAVRFASELESGTPVIESAVVTWLSHNERHLGMMECLRGLLGFVGSATV